LINQLGTSTNFTSTQLPKDPIWIELEVLASEYQDVSALSAAEKNRIRSLLELVLPEYLGVFKDPATKTSLRLLILLGSEGKGRVILDLDSLILRPKESSNGERVMKKKVSSVYPFLFGEKESFGVERFRPSILERLSFCASRLSLYLEQEEHLKERLLDLYYQLPYHEYLDSIPGTSPSSMPLSLPLWAIQFSMREEGVFRNLRV